MTIQLRVRHLLYVLALALAIIAACGKVSDTVDAPGGGGDTCLFDQSTWDNCTLAP